MDLKQAIAALGKARLYDPCTLCREDIPTMPGVYLWSRKLNGDPAYVGRALGRNGLRGRIWGQHLKLRLECRSDHIANADWYQLAHAVIDENGVHWINKSRLHRNIARVERIAPDKTLNFIRKHLCVAWICPPESDIERLEDELKAHYRALGFSLYNRR